ncbi:S8 family serine peptidase [Ralstonia sp. 1B3]|uniref:S8 family serine peptidase n=1 Tax=Ralstonia sp. 1B3 TaxID=2997421 RepID=UPI002FC73165
MTHNFDDGSNDPTPADIPANIKDAHGTNVAGIIAAAQNGKGVMGIAPRATLGGARFIGAANPTRPQPTAARTGRRTATSSTRRTARTRRRRWSTTRPPRHRQRCAPSRTCGGRGLVMLKASGNEYESINDGVNVPPRTCPTVGASAGMIGCETPANDPEALSPG